jgi:integrase
MCADQADDGVAHLPDLEVGRTVRQGGVLAWVRERFSRTFTEALARCRRELAGAEAEPPPGIHLHGLRHTHATLLLSTGKPVKVVSERLGHSSAVITMTVYAHVLPGWQREAADSFDAMIGGAQA